MHTGECTFDTGASQLLARNLNTHCWHMGGFQRLRNDMNEPVGGNDVPLQNGSSIHEPGLLGKRGAGTVRPGSSFPLPHRGGSHRVLMPQGRSFSLASPLCHPTSCSEGCGDLWVYSPTLCVGDELSEGNGLSTITPAGLRLTLHLQGEFSVNSHVSTLACGVGGTGAPHPTCGVTTF